MSEVIFLGMYFEVSIKGNDTKYLIVINADSRKFSDYLSEYVICFLIQVMENKRKVNKMNLIAIII